MKYGIRGWDVNGKLVQVEKIFRAPLIDDLATRPLPFEVEDFLLIKRDLKEWFFYASSVTDSLGEVSPSYGRVSVVQYRYVPVTVNPGYEYGSIETFEYGRASAGSPTFTDNGVPMPYIDTGRP